MSNFKKDNTITEESYWGEIQKTASRIVTSYPDYIKWHNELEKKELVSAQFFLDSLPIYKEKLKIQYEKLGELWQYKKIEPLLLEWAKKRLEICLALGNPKTKTLISEFKELDSKLNQLRPGISDEIDEFSSENPKLKLQITTLPSQNIKNTRQNFSQKIRSILGWK